MKDVLGIFERMKEMYIRYMNSPFALGNEKLSDERNQLLKSSGNIYQYPYIEAMPAFKSSGRTIRDAWKELGWSEDFVDFASKGLFNSDIKLHLHQFQAIQNVLKLNKNIVITSGTGSGKTESFLIPIIASIIEESKSWEKPNKKNEAWIRTGGKWHHNRVNENRKSAIRGLILYPLNALVEDQLVRLRKVLDSDSAREWLNNNRSGNRIFFGRYTGKSPVSGDKNSNNKSKLKKVIQGFDDKELEVRQTINDLMDSINENPSTKIKQDIFNELQDKIEHVLLSETNWSQTTQDLIKKKLNDKLEEKLSYINKVTGSEMVSRWDMQESPPDILLTNFSMLNISLTRDYEQGMFEQTKEWLQEDPSHTFHLVLDELHAYSGTAGTEVAYVLRTLLSRLGLQPDSHQLKILATSASLDESGKKYLEDFFGIPAENFEIIGGERESSEKYIKSEVYKTKQSQFKEFYRLSNEADDSLATIRLANNLNINSKPSSSDDIAHNILNEIGILRAFIDFCDRPKSLDDISYELFGDKYDLDAIGGVIKLIIISKIDNDVLLPLRAHLFFRNFQGVWACSNPSCDSVDEKYKYPERNIGKLYSQPRVSCDCGSRVLDFYYCQNCGEGFLGGYKIKDHTNDNTDEYILSADFPDLEVLPEKSPASKKYGNYAVYYPSLELDEDAKTWKKTSHGKKYNFSWAKANFNHSLGKVHVDSIELSGHWYQINSPTEEVDNFPAFPIICPNCAEDWEGSRKYPIESVKRTRSPIRGQKTGFDMLMHVMLDSLLREFSKDESPKSVLFSDSRQDAAKLSAKLELNHYRLLLRYVIVEAFKEYNHGLRLYVKLLQGSNLDNLEKEVASEYELMHQEEVYWLKLYILNGSESIPTFKKEEIEKLYREAQNPPKLKDLKRIIHNKLLKIGVNPGSPDASYQFYMDNKEKKLWTDLYEWSNNPEQKSGRDLTNSQTRLLEKIEGSLTENLLVNVLFSQRKRDLESLLLGRLSINCNDILTSLLGKEEGFWKQVIESSVRILGGLKCYEGNENRAPRDNVPPQLKKYWEEIAKREDIDPQEFVFTTDNLFKQLDGVNSYLLIPDEIIIVPYNNNDIKYECIKCHRIHLQPSCNICTECFSGLAVKKDDITFSDYYRYLTEDKRSYRRLHCEELTGQTDPNKSLVRQLQFQKIFDKSDIPLVDEIDILSVTTTMEAGVDIGSLRMVAMSNMPPQRFNYQQRVGRCGRRESALSLSLTMCRGRSHDDWYFDNLDSMTGDLPPQPYIDLKSVKIFRRVVLKEVLFEVYKNSGIKNEIDGGNSVHGEYGSNEIWNSIKDRIQNFIISYEGKQIIGDIIRVLTFKTELSNTELEKLSNSFFNGEIINEITEVANDPRYSDNNLSTNLATAGLLPMFGFPTRIRSLHHKPRTKNTLPQYINDGVMSRDLEIAISEYAPGSELVKDKVKHRSVGIVNYKVKGNKIESDNLPFGPIRTIALCKRCHFLFDKEDRQPNACPSCGQPKNIEGSPYLSMSICEPKGFRTDWIDHDFDEQFEWSSSGSFPRLAQDAESANSGEEILNLNFNIQEGNVYIINDNYENLFDFAKSKDPFGGWIEKSLIGEKDFNSDVLEEGSQSLSLGLAAIKNTEVLLLKPKYLSSSLSLDPSEVAVRAGLYSFGFLFRRIATSILDIDGDEIQVGVRASRDSNNDRSIGEIFLADQLINGAGYAKHIAQPDKLKTILNDILGEFNYIPKLREHSCDSSCYECLRTYQNRGFHGLLDWRLAIDVANMFADSNFTPKLDEKWLPLIRRNLKSLISNYENQGIEERWYSGIPGIAIPEIEYAVIFGHPLWNKSPDYFSEYFSEATVEAEDEFPNGKVLYFDIFDLVRRPVQILHKIQNKLGE